MSRTFTATLFALAALALSLPAHAGKGGPQLPPTIDPTISKSGRNDNRLYVGINWNIGARTGATAVVGYRGAKVGSGSHVHGYKAEVSYVLSGAPMGFGEARIKYINGTRSMQVEPGAGWSFAHNAFLLNIGGQAPFIGANLDYLVDKGWLASIGVNSLNRVRGPRETAGCPAGYTLGGGTCTLDD
jgi:hypothetical protein